MIRIFLEKSASRFPQENDTYLDKLNSVYYRLSTDNVPAVTSSPLASTIHLAQILVLCSALQLCPIFLSL